MIGLALGLWRWRWVAVALGLGAAFGWLWLDARVTRGEAALLRQQVASLLRANQESRAAIAGLREERAAFDRVIADRDSSARALKARISSLTRKALSNDASNDCPLSPYIDDVLDGLSIAPGNGDAG